MIERFVGSVCLLLVFGAGATFAQRPGDLEAQLDFEVEHTDGRPTGWTGGPAETLFVDGDTLRSGRWAGRIERTTESSRQFSSMTMSFDVDFSGESLELRAYLKTEDVAGWAGLWLREDGDSGAIEFKNHQDLNLHGTTDWTQYTLQLPFNPKAKKLLFGILLVGQGRVWVDDVELLLDGRPLSQAPVIERAKTVLDTDTEFDTGSDVEIETLTDTQVQNLTRLGKVWGFLKYHHPAVTQGQHHWDYALFRVLPAILAAEGRKTANEILSQWIAGFGEIEPCERCAKLPDDGLHLEPPLDWIHDEATYGARLVQDLNHIYANRDRTGRQFFVGPASIGVGNPEFKNEESFQDVAFPDQGVQLLALFRYWNIIEYWFPYRDVIGEDWDSVLAEYVPKVALAAEREEFEAHLAMLIARIRDTHGGFATESRPPQGSCTLPIRVRIVQDRAVVAEHTHEEKGPASGLKIGDVIETLDDQDVQEMMNRWAPYYSASNEPTRQDRMAGVLTVGNCSNVVVTGSRGDGPFEVTSKRIPLTEIDRRAGWTRDLPGEAFRLLDERVAYLKLSEVETDKIAEYVEKASGTVGWIIDIRNYPAEFVVFALGGRLVEKATAFARFTKANYSNPGVFSWTQPMVLMPVKPRYAGKVVILVDEVSISQAEYTTMALRSAPDAIVIGSTTAGADGNVSSIPLPWGMRTMISGIGVFYPDKTPTQRVGIVPDIEIKPTVDGLRQGRDELLERALREVLGPDVEDAEIRRIAGSGRARQGSASD